MSAPMAESTASFSPASLGIQMVSGAMPSSSPLSPVRFCISVSTLPSSEALKVPLYTLDCLLPFTLLGCTVLNRALPSALEQSNVLPLNCTVVPYKPPTYSARPNFSRVRL